MWENDYEGMENWENFEKVIVSEEILVMLFLTFLPSSDRLLELIGYLALDEIQD